MEYTVFARSPFSLPQTPFFACSGPPFVIRSVLIGWGCPGLQMVDLSERENGFWGRERRDRANTEWRKYRKSSLNKEEVEFSACYS